MITRNVNFHDLDDGCFGVGTFHQWLADEYCCIPVIGDLVFIKLDDGSEALWRVEERTLRPYEIDVYCRVYKQLKDPVV